MVDLAKGHVKALQFLRDNAQVITVNLGTGVGYSVLDVVKTFERVSGKMVPYKIVAKRVGDVAECYADPSAAKEQLDWKAKFGLVEMCEDTWRWQCENPDGYRRSK